ncbi:MAG: hypothetical protein ABEH78_08545 [Haloferacaceae archaeon]
MPKVSVGLRGWRFDESAVFTPDGDFRPLDEMGDDDRERLLRLAMLVEEPCDACYLIHGESGLDRCRQAAVVYGEPGDEVVLCTEHETDFVYWFREAGGDAYRGDPELRDAFHEWFADGGRAPEAYVGVEHVDTGADDLPEPPDPAELQRRIEAEFEGERVDLKAVYEQLDDGSGDEDRDDGDDDRLDPEAVAESDVDLDTEYPTG